MVKILWLVSLAEALAAICLYPLGRKHLGAMIATFILAVLAWGGYVALIILLLGGTFYL